MQTVPSFNYKEGHFASLTQLFTLAPRVRLDFDGRSLPESYGLNPE